MIRLPVDFEERVRRPPVAGGAGYPYRISAKDLMDNFKALAEGGSSGGGGSGSFAVAFWTCTIQLSGSDPETLITQRNDGSPDNVIYFHNGFAFFNSVPSDFPPAGSFTVINVPIYNPQDSGPFPVYPWDTEE